jgi:phosphate starvation-inducible PhoH-like protein
LNQIHETAVDLEFKNNKLLPLLFGDRDRHLQRIENALHVNIKARGNYLSVSGQAQDVAVAKIVLNRLYDRLSQGRVVSLGEIDAAIRMAKPKEPTDISISEEVLSEVSIVTRKRVVTPRTAGQVDYIKMLQNYDLVFAMGPAGTGKTYLATAIAVSYLLTGRVESIILSRPAVEAGEKLGFLPGDVREKVDPYLRPLYDCLHDMLPTEQIERRIASGEIEVAPIAFMRGRTLSRSYVILDEAQNTTVEQMKMFLTRLGDDSRMVVTADLTQIDLPKGVKSGITDALEVVSGVEGIGFCYLKDTDVLRHPLVSKIVKAYNKRDR